MLHSVPVQSQSCSVADSYVAQYMQDVITEWRNHCYEILYCVDHAMATADTKLYV